MSISLIENDMALGPMVEKKARPIYSIKFKKKVVKDILDNNLKIKEAADKYKVTPNVVSAWKCRFIKEIKRKKENELKESLLNSEESVVSKLKEEYEKKLANKNVEIVNLYKLIGKLTVKLDVK